MLHTHEPSRWFNRPIPGRLVHTHDLDLDHIDHSHPGWRGAVLGDPADLETENYPEWLRPGSVEAN